MLRVMLPRALASLSAIDVPIRVSVYIFVVIILVVNVDVAAAPIAVSPGTAPSAPRGGTERNSRAPR
jgi:hypothetical protein